MKRTFILTISLLFALGLHSCTLLVPIEEAPEGFWCNDGELDEDEECDEDNFRGMTCDDFGNFTSGSLKCSDECTIDTSMCVPYMPEYCDDGNDNDDDGLVDCDDPDCDVNISCGGGCGDNVHDASSEDCDGGDMGEAKCSDFGFVGGQLRCNYNCTYDKSNCTNLVEECTDGFDNDGDGFVDCFDTDCCHLTECSGSDTCSTIEICDDGIDNDNDNNIDCDDPDCEGDVACPAKCGNNGIDEGEECDGTDFSSGVSCDTLGYDGGTLACNADCTYNVDNCGLWGGNGVGAACTSDPNCDGFSTLIEGVECLSSITGLFAFENGYCSFACDPELPYECMASGGSCYTFTSGESYCLKSCGSSWECREPEYTCAAVPGSGSTETYCLPAPGLCTIFPDNCNAGESCYPQEDTAQCATTGTAAAGETCSFFNDCIPGYMCDSGSCHQVCRVSEGNSDCSSGVCTPISGSIYGSCSD